MKKRYEKPQVAVEKFNFQQSIADNCGHDYNSTLGHPTHGNPSSCAWQLGNGILIWTSTNVGCGEDDIESPDYEFDGACYNAPSGTIKLFASY